MFFDANFGQTSSRAAQRGEVHCIADAFVLNGRGAASIIEYHSNKIAGTVQNSMAGESALRVGVADKLRFNRKMLEAFRHGYVDAPKEWRNGVLS